MGALSALEDPRPMPGSQTAKAGGGRDRGECSNARPSLQPNVLLWFILYVRLSTLQ